MMCILYYTLHFIQLLSWLNSHTLLLVSRWILVFILFVTTARQTGFHAEKCMVMMMMTLMAKCISRSSMANCFEQQAKWMCNLIFYFLSIMKLKSEETVALVALVECQQLRSSFQMCNALHCIQFPLRRFLLTSCFENEFWADFVHYTTVWDWWCVKKMQIKFWNLWSNWVTVGL